MFVSGGIVALSAKLAYFVDDRPEITTNPNQNGKTLQGLFSLTPEIRLLRDYESPNDELIEPSQSTPFSAGPVFITQQQEQGLRITVNHRVFTEDDGVTEQMTGLAIATLVYPENPSETKVQQGEKKIGHEDVVHIEGCEVFEVVRKQVKGGYELSRVQREIEILRKGGLRVTIVDSPTPAVIYHDLKTQSGCDPACTDVLVPIPSGYPCEIDLAYLPEGSLLIGRVEGNPQDPRIKALDRQWQQISYHPHRGGGAPPFNPIKHGFHTYVGEVLSWLSQLK